jgi:bifunctional non-homologous end joining protein LigD
MAKPISKSRRQYVHVNNGPAQRLARKTAGAKPAPMPDYIDPLLATEGPPPRGDKWLHEIKYDGYRFQLHLQNGQPKFFTRRGNDWSNRVNSLVLAAGAINSYGCILDGEVVVPLENGGTDFGALESELKQSGSNRIAFYAFDLLYLDGLDLRRAALVDRKALLELLLDGVPYPIVYSDHMEGDGPTIAREACNLQLEGIVSKRRDAPYVSGRGSYWIKKPCRKRETFIVAGWAEKRGKFDGIYLAQAADGGDLLYAGKLERGFDDKQEKEMMTALRPIATNKKPIRSARTRFPKARWVEPRVMVEAEFRGKTAEGLVRHPSYKGIRRDLAETLKRRRRSSRRS